MPRATKAAQRQLHAEASCPSVAGDTFWFPYTPPICRFHHFMWLPNLAFLLASVPVERLAQRATVLIVDEWTHTSSFLRGPRR